MILSVVLTALLRERLEAKQLLSSSFHLLLGDSTHPQTVGLTFPSGLAAKHFFVFLGAFSVFSIFYKFQLIHFVH